MLRSFRLLPSVAAFLAAAASAQSAAPAAADAAGTILAPSLSYRSPLDGYRAFTEEEPIPWREANDTVGRIGGWREYARDSATPTAPAQPETAPAANPPAVPAGHGGHQH